jgi:phosphonoacetaldehyde hydrolase
MRGDDCDGGPTASIAAVVFDWAGTVVDFGSLAPMNAFKQLFERHGVAITIAEARAPMGLPKWQHIQAIGAQPRVAQAWRDAHGGAGLVDADVDALYDEYAPMNRQAVTRHAQLVPGVVEVVQLLRARGIAIGSTTGYARDVIRPLVALAAQQGFTPDNLVCADDVRTSRPSPMGMFRTFLDLGVWPAWRVVKVDDTVPGLLEGRHAGCWTVAVTVSGNEVGLSLDAWNARSPTDQSRARAHAADRLAHAHPDYTIDTVADLPTVLQSLERRLAAGQRPQALR